MFYFSLSINQVYQWKSSFLNMEPANNSCMFPVEVFTIVPITFMFVNLIAQADRTLSFGIFYPIVVFMLGVLIPLYIIVKKKLIKLRETSTPLENVNKLEEVIYSDLLERDRDNKINLILNE